MLEKRELKMNDFFMKVVKFEKQAQCSHSFNDEDVCEYCDLPEEDYYSSEAAGEPIGVYE
jgi:hypothetical protein